MLTRGYPLFARVCLSLRKFLHFSQDYNNDRPRCPTPAGLQSWKRRAKLHCVYVLNRPVQASGVTAGVGVGQGAVRPLKGSAGNFGGGKERKKKGKREKGGKEEGRRGEKKGKRKEEGERERKERESTKNKGKGEMRKKVNGDNFWFCPRPPGNRSLLRPWCRPTHSVPVPVIGL